MTHRLLLCILCLATLPALAGGQGPITIRKKPLAKGNLLVVDIKMQSKFEAQKWSPAGRSVFDTAIASDDRLAFSIEPLEFSKEGRLLMFYRTFDKAERMQNGQPYQLAFDGRKFLHAEKNGKDEIFSEKGQKLPLAVLLDLESQSIPCDPTRADWNDLLPTNPVKLDDSWPINPRRWIADYDVDLTKVKAIGTLKKVDARGGKSYGLIEYLVEVPLAGTRYQGTKLPITDGSVLSYKGAVEMNLDGSETCYVSRGILHIATKARGPDVNSLDTRVALALDIEITERCD